MLPNRDEYLQLLERITQWQTGNKPEQPFFVFDEEATDLLNWFIKYRELEFPPEVIVLA